MPEQDPSPQTRVAGSFRDPSGYVFQRGGDILRAVDEPCHQVLQELVADGLFGQLVDDGLLVPTETVEDESLARDLAREHPGFVHFLKHQRLTDITYPYEWCVSMLADAAVCTLDLQMRLLGAGCSLKDATPYNVQFVRGRPTWIDVSSIERPKRLDLWFALGQFMQTFLYPLLLCRHRGWDLRSYFLASLGGRGIEEVAAGFGWLGRLRPGIFWDVTLPLWLHRWAEKGDRARRETLEKPKQDTTAQVFNLRRLRRKTRKLAARYRPRGVWSEYTDICNYDDRAEAAKKTLVEQFLRASRPRRVLDLGSNTGDYSRLAAECGAEVTAVDGDHDAVELLYRRLRAEPAAITPMVVDLCNPSPAIGYMNRERESFLDRAGADCVLALALIHHLLVSGNLSLEAIRDMLLALTRRDLVLEFIPTDDGMFRRLMKFRVDLFAGVTLDSCRSVFGQGFQILKEEPIPGSKRTLLFLRKTEGVE